MRIPPLRRRSRRARRYQALAGFVAFVWQLLRWSRGGRRANAVRRPAPAAAPVSARGGGGWRLPVLVAVTAVALLTVPPVGLVGGRSGGGPAVARRDATPPPHDGVRPAPETVTGLSHRIAESCLDREAMSAAAQALCDAIVLGLRALDQSLPAWQDPGLDEEVASAAEEPAETPAPQAVVIRTLFDLVSDVGLSWPVLGRITSMFGPAHPMGIDIAANTGDPIRAAAAGRVAFSGVSEEYGNFTLINHAGGYATLYAHFMQPAEVAAGSVVQRGQVVGYAGDTGKSFGPHLHFEVRRYLWLVDPLAALPRIPLAIDPDAYRAPEPVALYCPGDLDAAGRPLPGAAARANTPDACATATPTPSPTATPAAPLLVAT
ncbi:MAG: M23 family metallopeptidase, partial [Dehalococcoidia bacterium]